MFYSKFGKRFFDLIPHYIKKIADTYWQFKDVEGFAKVMSNKQDSKQINNSLENLFTQLKNIGIEA